MKQQSFYSSGKLLLSSEYVVLDGVKALAVPCKMGQSMRVTQGKAGVIQWISYDKYGSLWMQEQILIQDILNGKAGAGHSSFYQTLIDVLIVAHTLNSNVLNLHDGFQVECFLSFPRLWGLGTSSTWINNVAQWFEINPYELLENSFKGSGYDIACASAKGPIWYTRSGVAPLVEPVALDTHLTSNLYFVYLNTKQDSKQGIANYRANRTQNREDFSKICQAIEDISQDFAKAKDLKKAQELMHAHEQIISELTGERTVKDRLFSDFQGGIKSLGAWGGDFIMVAFDQNPESYFQSKGYSTILSYKDMVL